MDQNLIPSRMVEDFIIVGVSHNLTQKQNTQINYITSISFQTTSQVTTPLEKVFQLSDGIFLHAKFKEKNQRPLADIAIFDINSVPQLWVPAECPQEYDICGQRVFYKRVQDLIFQAKIQDINIIKFGQFSSFCSTKFQIKKENEKVIVLPSSQDSLFIEMSGQKKVTDLKYKPLLLERYPINQPTPYLLSLPDYCFPEGVSISQQALPYRIFNFILTPQNGDRLYCTCLEAMEQCLNQFKELKSFKQLKSLKKSSEQQKNYNSKQKINQVIKKQKPFQLYYQKAYIIISKFKYIDQFSECLQNLYLYSMHSTLHDSCSMRDLIRKFVDGLILPQEKQKSGIKNKVGSKTTIFQTVSQYPPVSERAIYCLFKILDPLNIFIIFKMILLQQNIFFVSSSKTILGLVTQAFLDLIFPFKWEHVLIPILPSNLLHFLQSPVPIIAGFSPQTIDESLQQSGLLVYLDRNCIRGEHMLHDIKFGKSQAKFKKHLKKYDIYCHNAVFQYFQSNQNPSFFRYKKGNLCREPFEPNRIRNQALTFFRSILKDYQNYVIAQSIKQDEKSQDKRASLLTRSSKQRFSFKSVFKMKEFRSHHKISHKKQFLYRFTETSNFSTFIERFYSDSQDSQIQFFNSKKLFSTNSSNNQVQCFKQNDKFQCVHCISKEAVQIIQKSISLQHMISRQSKSIDEPSLKIDIDFSQDDFDSPKKIKIKNGLRKENSDLTPLKKCIMVEQEFQQVDEQSFIKAYLGRLSARSSYEQHSPVIDQSTKLAQNKNLCEKILREQEIQKTMTNNQIISMLQRQRQRQNTNTPLPRKNKQKQMFHEVFPILQNNQMLFNTIQDTLYNQSVLSQPLLNSERNMENEKKASFGQWICRSLGCVSQTAARVGHGISEWIQTKVKWKKNQYDDDVQFSEQQQIEHPIE